MLKGDVCVETNDFFTARPLRTRAKNKYPLFIKTANNNVVSSSFFYRTPKDWNLISNDIIEPLTTSCFLKRLQHNYLMEELAGSAY